MLNQLTIVVCRLRSLQIALDIACGVSHIHSKNIIHGDLSPANVLLKTDENRVGILKAVAKVGVSGIWLYKKSPVAARRLLPVCTKFQLLCKCIRTCCLALVSQLDHHSAPLYH
jgi:serine/threonine protein kinase